MVKQNFFNHLKQWKRYPEQPWITVDKVRQLWLKAIFLISHVLESDLSMGYYLHLMVA